jgi:hypothetical protein
MNTYTAIVKFDKSSIEEVDVQAASLKEAKQKIKEVLANDYGGNPKITKIIKRGPGLFL